MTTRWYGASACAALVVVSLAVGGCYETLDTAGIDCPPRLPECAADDYDGDGVANGEDDFPLEGACAVEDDSNCGACGHACSAGAGCLDGRCSGLAWRSLSAGSFEMGSGPGDGYEDERPRHTVTLSSFYIQVSEVTVSQWAACVSAGACSEPGTGGSCTWGASGRDEPPVNCVDWEQARAFCEWAGGRLCSESEWEYAARSGGRDEAYPWGDEEPTCGRAQFADCSGDTAPVCSKPEGDSAQGLCDLAGNVGEWVEDDWHRSYDGAPSDGSAWVDSPRASYRVSRGGCWNTPASFLRTANRGKYDPSDRVGVLGLRCCR